MPSPFPGMDPFLESPRLFPDFHDSLIFCVKEALRRNLPAPYYAATRERVWVEVSKRYIDPDVRIGKHNGAVAPPLENAGTGGVALAVRTEPIVVHVPHDETRENFLEIYVDREKRQRLVTSIEILSPSNKTPGQEGRKLFLQKQQEILASQTNLIEIDLLRGGVHSTAVPLEFALEKTGPFDYHVCCYCFERWEDYLVYPIHLMQKLPTLAIPLLPEDPDVTIDLQAVFERCYDAGFYDRLARYEENQPDPSLPPDKAAWATKILREKGLLK